MDSKTFDALSIEAHLVERKYDELTPTQKNINLSRFCIFNEIDRLTVKIMKAMGA